MEVLGCEQGSGWHAVGHRMSIFNDAALNRVEELLTIQEVALGHGLCYRVYTRLNHLRPSKTEMRKLALQNASRFAM